MSLTNEKQQSSEPFYRREFKQEQYLYEESSNVANPKNDHLSDTFQYFVIAFVGLLFAGCLGLLMLDLVLPRFRENINEQHRRRTRARLLQAMDEHSPILPRREQPRDDPFLQLPQRDAPRNDLHRRREAQPVNHQPSEPYRGPTAFQFAFDDSSAKQEIPDRPAGRQLNNTRASPNKPVS